MFGIFWSITIVFSSSFIGDVTQNSTDFVSSFTPVAGSIFRKLSQTHISKRELKNGHISRIFSVFQVIQEISPAKFFSAEEVDLRFNSETKEHPQISKPSFGKETVKTFFYKCSNSGRNESTPQTQNNVSWISYQVKQISKSRS